MGLRKIIFLSTISFLLFAPCRAQSGESPDQLINKTRDFIAFQLERNDSTLALEAMDFILRKYPSRQITPFSNDEMLFLHFLGGNFSLILNVFSTVTPKAVGGFEQPTFYEPPNDRFKEKLPSFFHQYRVGVFGKIDSSELREDAREALKILYWIKSSRSLNSLYQLRNKYDGFLIRYPDSRYLDILSPFFQKLRYPSGQRDEVGITVLMAAGVLGKMEQHLGPGAGIGLLYRRHWENFFLEYIVSTHAGAVNQLFKNGNREFPKEAAVGFNLFQVAGGKRFFPHSNIPLQLFAGLSFANIRVGTLPRKDDQGEIQHSSKIPVHNQLHLNFGFSYGYRFTKRIWNDFFSSRRNPFQTCGPGFVDHSSAICFKFNYMPEIPVGGKSFQDCILTYGIWYEFGKNRQTKWIPKKIKQCILKSESKK